MSIKNIVTSQLAEITTYDAGGNITGVVVEAVTANTVTANTVSSTGNIDAPGNVSGANLLSSGAVIATGNVDGGNIVTSGQVVASGNITGDNFNTSGLIYAAGDISAANFNTAGTANVGTLAVVGNATVANNITVTGNATAANYTTAGAVSATGNVTGGNLNTAGQVVATGNVTAANLVSPGDVDISGNVYANYVFATGNIVADGNVDATIVNTANVYGPTLTLSTTGTDEDLFLSPNGFGNIVINESYINGVLDPVQDQDVATKAYVDSVAVGLQYKLASNVATTVGLPAYSYNNGALGVGATITGNVNGLLTIDTVAMTAGQRVLVKNETATNAPYNGIYDVTVPGDAGNVYVLTRSTDDDTDADMYGAYTFIESGNVNGTTSWTCTASSDNPITIGTSPITWVQFARPSAYQAGNALSLNGTIFNVNVDNSTMAIVGANLVVKASANLVTPNIGNAVGNSLTLVGTGNINGGNLDITGITTVGGNLSSGNLSTGAIIATGNISGANETLSGELTANATITGGNLVTSGTLAVTGDGTLDGSLSVLTELYVGPTANLAAVTGPVIFAEGASNAFSQIGLQSINGNSSADMITYANNGSDSDGFADIGVTGNTFNDTNYTVTAPNDGYLFVQGTANVGGNLVLATGDVGNTHDIVFATGGFLAANEKMRLVDATATLQPTANTGVDLGSNTNYFGNLYAGTATLGGNVTTTANISASYFIGNGALLTGITGGGGGNAIAINNGTSNVKIGTANGNISMSVANVANIVTVNNDSSLRVTGNIYDQYGQVYGVAASFAKYKRTTQQTTDLTVNGRIICNVQEDATGSDINVNTGTGQVTLQAGKSYRLMGGCPTWTGSGSCGIMWYNETTASYIGSAAENYPGSSGAAFGAMGGTAEVILTPTVTTVVSLRVSTGGGITALGGNTDFNTAGSYPWIDIQVIGGGSPITTGVNAAAIAKYTRTTTQTGIAANSVVICNVQEALTGSSITVDSTTGNVTLQAGGTYRVRGQIGHAVSTGSPAAMAFQWYNATTGAWVGQPSTAITTAGGGSDGLNMGTAEYVFTPSVNTVLQFRVTNITNTTSIASDTGIGTYQVGAPYIDVQQIGGAVPVTNTVQYGSATIIAADGVVIGTGIGAATTLMSYALPGPGTWRISTSPIIDNNGGSNQWPIYALFDNSGTLVPGTYTSAGYYSGGLVLGTVTSEFVVTTTTATTYTIRAWKTGGTQTFINNTTYGQSYGNYIQIGGFLPYVNAAAKYNTITSIVNASTTTSTTPGLMPGSTFSLPAAGTYQINYSLTVRSNTTFGIFTSLWNLTTNTEVPSSSTFAGYEEGTAGTYTNMSCTTIVTVSAATTFAIYWASGSAGATSTVYNNYNGSGAVSAGKGDSVITYNQIGTLPAAVESVLAASYAKYTRTTSQTGVNTGTVIVCNVLENQAGSSISVDSTTGNITLQAGGTYRLRGSPGVFTGGSGRLAVQWWNATTSAWIGEPSMALSPTAANSYAPAQGPAECVITPTSTTVVQFKIGYANTSGDLNANNAQTGTSDSGAPWIDVQQIGGYIPNTNVAQYGTATLNVADNTAINSSYPPSTNILTYNIPSAGTWQLSAMLTLAKQGTSASYAQYILYDSTGNPVTGTTTLVDYTTGSGDTASVSANFQPITVAGPTTYTVRAWSTSGAVNLRNIATLGYSYGSYNQIAGLLPYAPNPTASFVKYTRTTDQTSVVANTAVICNVLESSSGSDIAVDTTTGNITLTANKTYRLRGTVGYCNTTGVVSAMSYQWFNVTGNAWIGQGGGVISASGTATDAWQSGTAEYVFTPGANTTVQLRVVGTSASNAITPETGAANNFNWRIGAPFIDIEVIAQPVPSSGQPNWTTAGTIQGVGWGATTTAPTFWTSGTISRNVVRYKQLGAKTWQVTVQFTGTGLGGATAGSGDYLFTLPNGLRFDSTVQPFYTAQVGANGYGIIDNEIPGSTGWLNRGSGSVCYGAVGIVPWDATRYRFALPLWGTGVYCYGSTWFQLTSGTDFSFYWTFTFQSE